MATQLLEMRGVEHRHAAESKRLDVVAGIFSLHLAVAVIFLAFAVIPGNHLQRAARLPQRALVFVEAAPQFGSVGHLFAIYFNLIPRHKQRLLVAEARFGAQPFAVEIVAHAVGS